MSGLIDGSDFAPRRSKREPKPQRPAGTPLYEPISVSVPVPKPRTAVPKPVPAPRHKVVQPPARNSLQDQIRDSVKSKTVKKPIAQKAAEYEGPDVEPVFFDAQSDVTDDLPGADAAAKRLLDIFVADLKDPHSLPDNNDIEAASSKALPGYGKFYGMLNSVAQILGTSVKATAGAIVSGASATLALTILAAKLGTNVVKLSGATLQVLTQAAVLGPRVFMFTSTIVQFIYAQMYPATTTELALGYVRGFLNQATTVAGVTGSLSAASVLRALTFMTDTIASNFNVARGGPNNVQQLINDLV